MINSIITKMPRAKSILSNASYLHYLSLTEKYEVGRIFCCHNLSHMLDTARIAYIENLEHSLGISKEIIYACALLHDIGRFEQYETGIKHAEASRRLCVPILKDCGFDDDEIETIGEAIQHHSSYELSRKAPLSRLLYDADKKSRLCFRCLAEAECDWPEERKNKNISD